MARPFAHLLGLLRSLAIYWRPGRQPGLRRLYAPFLGPGDLAIDGGAHLGDRSRAFAALGARVVALEPQPRLLPWLRLLAGRHPRVTVLGRALGAAPGTAELAVSAAAPTVSSLAPGWRQAVQARGRGFARVRWGEAATVPVTTLDALIAAYGLPAFIKLDLEGSEAAALRGLSQPVPALSIEFVTGALDIARDAVLRMVALGSYRGNVVAGEGRRFRFAAAWAGVELAHWLDAGADDLASGDVFLWRAEPDSRAGDVLA